MSNKLTIKQEKPAKDSLKGPDEFQQYVGKVADFFKIYGTRIGIGAGAVVLVIVVVVVAGRAMKNSDVKASTEFQTEFNKVASQVMPSIGMDKLPVADKATVDAARKAMADFSAANQGKEIAGMAKVGEGIAALHAGDAATAADTLKGLLDAGKLDAGLAAIANHAYAVAADQAGRRDDAIKAYELLAAGTGSMTKGYALLHLGDLFNPAMKVAEDQPADAAKAREYYDKAAEAFAAVKGIEAMLQQNTIKARIAGLK